jgi:hypothetical protein
MAGFAWGSIVFMMPALKSVKPIPYISSNPAISFPILIVWVPLSYLLAKSCLQASREAGVAGLKLGLMFSLVNLILDSIVLVLLLKAGFAYFISLTVWLGYVLLLIIPWLTGRSMQTNLKMR